MPEVIVLKPRRRDSPHTFNGVRYPQIVDELGVARITVEDPEFLSHIAGNPDVYELPQEFVIEEIANDTAVEEPAVVIEEPAVPAEAADEEPVAVVAVEPQPDTTAAVKPSKRNSRLHK